MDNDCSRRKFLRVSLGTLATMGLTKIGCSKDSDGEVLRPTSTPMPKRQLGKTGYNVCLFSLGGQATLEQPNQDDLADKIINRAIDLGVNYLDTAWYYGSGLSETYIGRVMKQRRNEVFLASKTIDRTYDGSMRQLDQSLTRLQTSRLDLWQLHNIRTQSDLNLVFGANGAVKALEKAKSEGVTRFIGITGHFDPLVLAQAINQYAFDTVLMALNAADVHYKSFSKDLLPTAVSKSLGIIAMKIVARGAIFRSGGITTIEQAMGYTLTHPVSTVIIGCSTVADVENNVRTAQNFRPLTTDQMRQYEALTQGYYRDASFFKFDW